jgi:hypothetical protein
MKKPGRRQPGSPSKEENATVRLTTESRQRIVNLGLMAEVKP